jgi:predicted metallo-beta-lactamase superfamily hydrolase
LLASCQSGEESAESAYGEAAEVIKTGQTHTVIERHCQQIKAFRTRLARLVGETKDGVEFQKNE